MPAPNDFEGTAPEYAVYQALVRLGFEGRFEFQSSRLGGRATHGGVVIDFYIPELHLAINVQGMYWHMERAGAIATDILQRAAIEASGIILVYIDEDDALRNAEWYVSEAIRGLDHSRVGAGL